MANSPPNAAATAWPPTHPRILVSTYAYNEHVKIEATVRRICETKFGEALPHCEVEVILADDGSTDDYPEKLQQKYGFTLIRNETNRGIGYSIRRVIQYGLDNGFDILVIMAGNNKDNPEEIPRLVEPVLAGRADFVQGARYLPGGDFGTMPLYRRVATQFVHPLVTFAATGKYLHDTTNGFRAIRLAAFRDPVWNLDQEWLFRYGMEYYLLYYFLKRYRFAEVPVSKIYPPKELGYTKISPLIGWWDIMKPMIFLMLGIKK
ncbi:MAG: glycosyltransferase family 2 protein [Candidatus Sumerlaeaceae bacterium]|nr:glycosyltransferase family 2 protein [Candidatus Sumerlaeaceae bacterium]